MVVEFNPWGFNERPDPYTYLKVIEGKDRYWRSILNSDGIPKEK